MDRQTQVKSMKVKSRSARLQNSLAEMTRVEELPPRPSWGMRLLQLDQLVRNLVVVGCLFMLVVAVKNTTTPEAQSVFGAIRSSAGIEWDESVGKLSFVNNLLPQSIQEVWSEKSAVSVFAPIGGNVVHAWSPQEPYVMIQSSVSDVRAADDGEVMSVAHGLEEERIIRIRHDDGVETIYGNLATCLVETGDRVYAGDVFAGLMEGCPLAFELRVDGRSIDPQGHLVQMEE